MLKIILLIYLAIGTVLLIRVLIEDNKYYQKGYGIAQCLVNGIKAFNNPIARVLFAIFLLVLMLITNVVGWPFQFWWAYSKNKYIEKQHDWVMKNVYHKE